MDEGSIVVLRSFDKGNLVNVAQSALDSAGHFILTLSRPCRGATTNFWSVENTHWCSSPMPLKE